MSQLIEDLKACVRGAKLINQPFGKYTMMNITTEHAEKILALIEATIVVDNSVHITPNNEKGAKEWEGMSRALSNLLHES
jgi:hypothetical protein